MLNGLKVENRLQIIATRDVYGVETFYTKQG